jgi:hypothetical protein
MVFPPYASGTIRVDSIPGNDLSVLVRKIEEALLIAEASRLHVNNDRITFHGGMLRGVPNWNILSPISSGEIRFSRSNESVLIHYRISFLALFLVVTVMFVATAIWRPFPNDIFVLPLMWLFLFGANYVSTVIRFSRLLARAAGAHLQGSLDSPFSNY